MPSKTQQVTDEIRCGDCGSNLFRVQHQHAAEAPRAGGGGTVRAADGSNATAVAGVLILICGDNHETIIGVSRPTLVFDGYACGGWRSPS